MNRIKRTFHNLRKSKKKAFIVYVTAGYPSMPLTEKIVFELEASGADIIELGVPFSDPMADGLTIQRSSEKSLEAGTTLKKILKSVKRIRAKSRIPIALMSYLNPIYRYGVERFVGDAVKSGVDGVIIPDLPPEESSEFVRPAKGGDFCVVFLASPTSTAARIRNIAARSRGFIYYVSLTGVTGARHDLPAHISRDIKRIKRVTDKPVCVGFGVSNAKQARNIARAADGVIVGSAVINIIMNNEGKKDLIGAVGRFVSGISKAVHGI